MATQHITEEEIEDVMSLEEVKQCLGVDGDCAEYDERFIMSAGKRKLGLLDYHRLPAWLQDNNYILTRYRPQLNSFKLCFRSIFSLHTETGNIWTHLIGWLGFCCFVAYAYALPLHHLTWYDHGMFAVFLLGAFFCLLFSWVFHCLQCHSPKVFRICINFDYCGVAMLIMSSIIAWIYYAFYCKRTLRIVYTSIMVLFGVLCIAVSLIKKFSSSAYRPVRSVVFLGLGTYGIVPMIHAMVVYGGLVESSGFNSAATGPMLVIGFVYVLGLTLYAFRIPERFWPGKFDIWCHSHQIFHVCVVIGVFLQSSDILHMANAHAHKTCS
ncbi:adiponectin receptor protein-like [Sycon ciliatum]|uniref:adiponectin receptor protein-like n=1 Tax=Sycon ciliatum TaxID=27933 RepID=UPI0020AB6AAC|eukprot:scpid58729/ scgid22826/ ADIPOR-like receptor CG5315